MKKVLGLLILCALFLSISSISLAGDGIKITVQYMKNGFGVKDARIVISYRPVGESGGAQEILYTNSAGRVILETPKLAIMRIRIWEDTTDIAVKDWPNGSNNDVAWTYRVGKAEYSKVIKADANMVKANTIVPNSK